MITSRRHFLKAVICLPFAFHLTVFSKSATGKPTITKSELKVLSRLAKCIAEVETKQNDRARGRVGERSQYQISEVVWRQHFPNRPFSECYGTLADECALRHLLWLKENLPPYSHFFIAYAWNAGLTNTRLAMSKGIVYAPSHIFARCVENLYNDRNFK